MNILNSYSDTALPPDDPKLIPRNSKVCLHCKALFRRDVDGEPTIEEQTLPVFFAEMADLLLHLGTGVTSTDKASYMVNGTVSPCDGFSGGFGGWFR